MPSPMQVALLRTLEEKVVRQVGSSRDLPARFRVVSATNRDLKTRVDSGGFRKDLLHRLNIFELHVPPLRDRMADLPELVQHMLGRLEQPREIDVDALAVLASHDWPGNVRELDGVVQAAALLSDEPVLGPEVFEDVIRSRQRARARSAPPEDRLAPRAGAIVRLLKRGWQSAPGISRELGVSTRTINRELKHLTQRATSKRSAKLGRGGTGPDGDAIRRDSQGLAPTAARFPRAGRVCGEPIGLKSAACAPCGKQRRPDRVRHAACAVPRRRMRRVASRSIPRVSALPHRRGPRRFPASSERAYAVTGDVLSQPDRRGPAADHPPWVHPTSGRSTAGRSAAGPSRAGSRNGIPIRVGRQVPPATKRIDRSVDAARPQA